jgi:putative aminopeptidase FrvX
VTTRLFPEFADQINALSVDNKASVRHLYDALDRAVREMELPFQVYAIVDRDGEGFGATGCRRAYSRGMFITSRTIAWSRSLFGR